MRSRRPLGTMTLALILALLLAACAQQGPPGVTDPPGTWDTSTWNEAVWQ